MSVLVPEYLSKETLPFVSDIFFHDELIYFTPPGFTDIEYKSVVEFPKYCFDNNLKLSQSIWDTFERYFKCDIDALNAAHILEPLRKKHVSINLCSYARDIKTIEKFKSFLKNERKLISYFFNSGLAYNMVSRELLSHVLYEVVLESGKKGAFEYFKENTHDTESLMLLVCAVMLNRFNGFDSCNKRILIFDQTILPLFRQKKEEDSDVIDSIQYVLFKEIINPIYGRCKTRKDSEFVATVFEKKYRELAELKKVCYEIATEIVLLPTTDLNIKKKRLSKHIEENICEPLSYLIEKPKKDMKSFIFDFLVDSTVIGGVLSLINTPDINNMYIALGAGASSNIFRLLRNKSLEIKVNPTELLLYGMKKHKVNHKKILSELREIHSKSII